MVATCNIKTGEIFGCEEGSPEYYHEKAHLDFNKKFNWINWTSQMCEFFTLIFLAITPFIDYFKYFSIASITLIIFLFIFEECWCNYESNKYLNNINHSSNIKDGIS